MSSGIKSISVFAVPLVLSAFLSAGCGSAGDQAGVGSVPFNGLPSPQAPANFQPSVVIAWNQEILKAVTAGAPRPTVISRHLFLIHSSIYEAFCAYSDRVQSQSNGLLPKRPGPEHDLLHQRAAVCYAAYHSASALFPVYEANTHGFSNLLAQLGYSTAPGSLNSLDPSLPEGVAHLAFQWVQQSRANDGSNQQNNFADTTSALYPQLYSPLNSASPGLVTSVGGLQFDSSRWTPLQVPNGSVVDADGFPLVVPALQSSFSTQAFLTPHWGAVTSFGSTTFGQFRPIPPPAPGSGASYTDATGAVLSNDQAYRQQADEIRTLNAGLNDRQKCIAEYWADGPTSDTPPGHWNEFAQDISYRDKHDLERDVKLFFVLNAGLMDSAICCWEAKRYYDYIRPVSAIQHAYFGQTIQGWGGPGKGTVNLLGQNWRPFQRLTFVTPAFAEYTSGHSTFSGCASSILSRFSGSSNLYDGVTRLPYDRNGDGQGDLLGEFTIRPSTLTIEPGLPAAAVTLRWNTLQEAAAEAGFSRRYGGIHFQDGDLRGRVAGAQVGEAAYARYQSLLSGEGK